MRGLRYWKEQTRGSICQPPDASAAAGLEEQRDVWQQEVAAATATLEELKAACEVEQENLRQAKSRGKSLRVERKAEEGKLELAREAVLEAQAKGPDARFRREKEEEELVAGEDILSVAAEALKLAAATEIETTDTEEQSIAAGENPVAFAKC